MENYKIRQRLGKGAQGSVYLAENRQDGKEYVLKKVECNDESEANKAFHEALALNELQHPYICGYKEFFVTWDKEDSAMFVCIVMDYYKNGDLSAILKQRRANNEDIEELLLKKWLGQLIEALVFVHKKKVIHRDLKPSNIFMQEDLSLSVGDFGVATVMADARTKTRTAVGSMNWMAPEVLERPYDERSDVWSAGCIALELATCSFCDSATMAGKLFEIKHNPQALEDLLERVGQTYSADLVSVIRTMLRRSFQQRPTAEELVDIPYIKECLTLSNSALAERKKQQQSAAAAGPLPKEKGIPPVVDYLIDNIGNEDCTREALDYLVTLTKEEGTAVEGTAKEVVAKAMKDHISESDIVLLATQFMNNVIITANTDDVMYSKDIVSIVPLAMKSHPTSPDIQGAAASLLTALSAQDKAAELIGSTGGIQDLLGAVRTFPQKPDMCAACLGALWNLTVNEDNARIATEEGAVRDVVKLMKMHADRPELLEPACALLLSLSMEDENLGVMNKLDCVGELLSAMQTHIREAKVVKNACMALAAIVEPDEEGAFKVLSNSPPGGGGVEVPGIPIIMQAYDAHKDNAQVVENICTLIMELCEYEEIRAEIKHLKIADTILNEVHKRFKDNKDIMVPCEAALVKIGGGKLQLQFNTGKNTRK